MEYEIICQNSRTGTLYNITSLAGDIQYQTYLNGQPGSLTFTTQQDPNNILSLANGSIISFRVDGNGIFWGYIFKMGTDATGVYKVWCYDQLRYLKNMETYINSGQTADKIFTAVCKDAALTKYRVITPSSFIVPEYLHDNKSLYSIIEYGIERANIAEGKQYFIRDKFGEIVFTELAQEKTNLIIGDGSLLSSYQYEISIDDDTYNQVKMIRDNKETGKREIWIAFDSNNQKLWGKLQLLQKVDEAQTNESFIRDTAEKLLKLKNRETMTLKLTAIGVPELVAGSGFRFSLDKLSIKQDMWIVSATHNYLKDFHTMSLDVFI